MKRKYILIVLFAVFLCFFFKTLAYGQSNILTEEIYADEKEEFDIDSLTNALTPDTRNALAQLGIKKADTADLLKGLSFGGVMKLIISTFLEKAGVQGSLFVSIAGVIILLSLFEVLKKSYGNKELDFTFQFISGAALCALIYQPLYGTAGGLAKAVAQTGDFMKALIPVFTAIMAAAGNISGAAIFSSMLFLSAQISLAIANGFMLPLVNLYMAAGVAASVSGNESLKHVTSFLRTVALWSMGLLLTVFTGMLALQGIVSGASDSVAKRSVKFAVGSLIPVAGSYIGEAVDTIFTSFKALKSAVGVFGVVAVLVMLLAPLLTCAANYLILKLGSLLSSVSGNSQATQVLGVMTEGFGMVFGISAFVCLMFLFSLTLAIVFTGGS